MEAREACHLCSDWHHVCGLLAGQPSATRGAPLQNRYCLLNDRSCSGYGTRSRAELPQ